MRPLSTLALASLLCLAGPFAFAQSKASPPAAAASSAARLTSAGHRFEAPADFSLVAKGPLQTLTVPEGNAQVVFADVEAKDADDAVAKAWALYKPGFARKLELATPRPPRDGWDEQKAFDYETSPNEKLVVQAIARRAGSKWVVVLLDGNEGSFEKRSAPIGKLITSLRPAGYERERFVGRQPHALDADRIAALKAFVADGMKALEIPGVGFSLIDGRRVVFEGGLGVRAMDKPDPVDADTLFMAASNTKAMSTLLLAQAVDAGKLRWDQPAAQAYPAFHLGDPAITRQVQIRHLVCACTGMPRQDLEWLFGDGHAAPASVFDQLGTMKPTSQFGEVFQYSNLMVAAGGYIAAQALEPGKEIGAAYDDAMQHRVFTPLGMTRTTFDIPTAMKGDHAEPHGDGLDGHTRRAEMSINNKIGPARPAGAVWTSPHDFSRFVLMELNQGKTPEGQTIVSKDNLLQRYLPQVMVGEDISYGMGLMVDRREGGITVVHHGGDLLGFHSDMFWLPDYGIGGTILTNSDSGVLLRGPFLRRLLELVFDGKPEAAERLKLAAANHKAGLAKMRERLTLPADPAEVAALAGRYQSADLGSLQVMRQGQTLRFEFKDFSSEVATRKNEDGSISFVTVDPGIAGIELVKAEQDGSRALIIRDAQHEYRFTEQKPLAQAGASAR